MKSCVLWAMILAVCAACGPYKGTVVEVSVCASLPVDTAELRPQILLEGQPLSGARTRAGAECRFGLELPSGASGEVQVTVDALDTAGCLLARGTALIRAEQERHLAVEPPLVESRACPVRLVVEGDGAGTLRSSSPAGLLECGPRSSRCAAPEVPLGTVLTLVTAAEPGSYPLDFAAAACEAVSGSGVAERSCTLMVRGAQTLTARFQRKPGVTVEVRGGGRVLSQPAGIDCRQASGVCAAYFNPAQEVAFRVEADEGSYFAGWDAPGCEGVQPCKLRVDMGTGLRARFAPRVCSAAGWCWESPLPQGNELRAVHGLSSTSVWAVGQAGTILSFDGQLWSGSVGNGGGNDLYAVLALGPKEAWVAGARGTLLRWQGAGWLPATFAPQLDPGGRALYALWAAGPGELWALGQDGYLCRSQADQWRCAQEVPAGQELRAVWAAGPDEVWVVGSGGAALRGKVSGGRVGDWSLRNKGVETRALSAVVGTADGARYVLADRAVWRLAPGQEQWVQEHPGFFEALAVLEDDTLVAIGDGEVHHRDAQGAWSPQVVMGGGALRAVTALPGGGAWAVGARGVLVRYQGGAWQNPLPSATTALQGVGGDGQGGALAVGEAGLILRRDGASGRWLAEPPQTSQTLLAVHEAASDDVWVTGSGSTLLHFQASRIISGNTPWEQVRGAGVPLDRTFYALAGHGGALFVGGSVGTLLRHDLAAKPGEGWTDWGRKSGPGSSSRIQALASLNGALYAAGIIPSVVLVHAQSTHSGDLDWEEKQDGSVLKDLPMAALFPVGGDLWAVGKGGQALLLPSRATATLPGGVDVVTGGAGADGLWIAGAGGLLLRGAGSPFVLSEVVSGTRVNLNRIFVRPSGEAWLVGDGGTILRRKGP